MEFLQRLQDVEVKEGSRVELWLEISSESAAVTWQRDGQNLDGEAGVRIEHAGRRHAIVIENATVHHEGEYIAAVGDQESSCELTVVGEYHKKSRTDGAS